MKPADSLAKASKDLMLKEPFYGLFLIQLNKMWSESLPTACVALNGINFSLIINPAFWVEQSDKVKIGVLKHELLHMAMNHLTTFNKYPESTKQIVNIAMDIEINQYIDPQYRGEGWMLPETFPSLNLEPKKGTDYYYEKLLQAAEKHKSAALASILDAMAQGQEQCQGENGETLQVPAHDWKEFEQLDESTKKLVESQLEYQMREAAQAVQKSRGTVPGEIMEILKKLEKEPPKFDWRGYLRRFAGGSSKVYTKKVRRKFNKRYEGNPGLKMKPKKHILVAVDTSGSVNTGELAEFFHEIDYIHRTGAEVTVLQCDTAIAKIEPYKRGLEVKIYGRGGTDFQPVIDYYNENQHKYTCLIFFTDGEAPAPDKTLGKLLWVLSTESKMNEALPGSVIQLN